MYQRKASVLQCSAFFIVQPQLSYPFICRQRSRLLPCPGYSKQCCNEHCFLVFVINSVPLRIQSSVPIFTQECDYWLDCSLPFWLSSFSPRSLLSLSPSSLFYLTLWISLGILGCGEHLGNWSQAGEHLGNWSQARLVFLLLAPLTLLLVTCILFHPLLFSMELREPLWVFQTVEST